MESGVLQLYTLFTRSSKRQAGRDVLDRVNGVLLGSIPDSNVGQGSQCHPIDLGRYVGPSAIPRKFLASIL